MPLPDRRLTDFDQLCARPTQVRKQGYAISDGKNAFGLQTVAAPILWPDATARAAVSLTVPNTGQELDAFIATVAPYSLHARG